MTANYDNLPKGCARGSQLTSDGPEEPELPDCCCRALSWCRIEAWVACCWSSCAFISEMTETRSAIAAGDGEVARVTYSAMGVCSSNSGELLQRRQALRMTSC